MNICDEFVTNLESVRIELSLNTPQLKASANSFILSVLSDLNVNHELDLFSLSFIFDNKNNLVQKVVIHCKAYEGKLYLSA